MITLVSFEIKFQTNQEKIEKIIQHYGMRKIQDTLYIGEISNSQIIEFQHEISEKIREYDSVIITPLCKNCYGKKTTFGREIKFKQDLWRVY